MIINKSFKRIGDTSDCVSGPFVAALMEREPIHQHTTPEAKEEAFRRYFEGFTRYEYVVLDDAREIQAIMVIIDHFDCELGQQILCPTMAYSLKPGLLFGAYRWLYELARHHGIQWVMTTKTDGYTQTVTRKQIKTSSLEPNPSAL
ncbi:hypothetical protein R3B00_001293 [Klebsiella pneumoniae]|nr:hypothetical protein [Klebsiella pneumoniae]ELQ8980631.1 hypothetical protein [Klebsiella pneumoniae]